MVWQVSTGDIVYGRLIKVPQTFINNVMRCIIFGKSGEHTDMLNVIHAVTTDHPVTLADVTAFATAVDSWVTAEYMPLVNNTITYVGTHVRSMEGLMVPKYSTSGAPVSGGISSDALPTYVSLPVILSTGLTGHASHGMFHPFPPSEQENTATGNPSATYVTNLEGAIDDLMAQVTAAGFAPVVASFKYGTHAQIMTWNVRNYWGSVVSRKLEHGR